MTTQIEERLAEALRAKLIVEEHGECEAMHPDVADNMARDALAEYEASRTHPAEGGEGRDYVLVPRAPTDRMISAGQVCSNPYNLYSIWAAMLAAAPPPQPVAPEERAGGVWMWVADKFVNRVHALVVSAPERGEAKAVAFVVRDGKDGKVGIYLRDYNVRIATFAENTSAEQKQIGSMLAAPSALRYRDPTIEDARALHRDLLAFVECHGSLTLQKVRAALNAIGAKMAEGEG